MNDGWHSIDDLAVMFDVTTRTLLNYFKEIEILLYKQIKFEFHNNSVRAIIAMNLGLISVQRVYMKHAFPYELIELSFFNDKAEIDDVTNELFTSASTVYRNTQRVNNTIEDKYKIKLQSSPLYFVGKEWDIQNFYVNFFNEFTEPMIWPFDNIDEGVISSLLKKGCKMFDVNLSMSDFRFTKLTIAVTAMRMAQGNLIDLKLSDSRVKLSAEYIKGLPELKYFYDFCNIKQLKLTQHDFVLQLFAYSLCKPFDYIQLYKHFDYEAEGKYKETYDKFTEMMTFLSDKYHIPLSDKQLEKLFISFKYHVNDFGSKEVFLSHSYNFIDRIKKISPEFINDLQKLLKKYCEEFHPVNGVCPCYLTYMICIEWDDLIGSLVSNKRKCKGIVVNYFDYRFAYKIKEFLMIYFDNRLEVDVYEENEFNLDDLIDSDYDFIFCDFPLDDIEGKHIINLESLPNRNDLRYISRYIMQRAENIY